jgi:oligopeptide transport system substrate-binding protein
MDPLMLNSRASQLASDYITIVNAKEYYLQGKAGTVSWEDVGIKRIDDYTLQLELTGPVTQEDVMKHFNYAWTCLVYKPLYEAGMNADRTKTTYGSSAAEYMSSGFFVLTDMVIGSQANMARNPDYVHADEIKLAGYSIKMLQDSNTALQLFLNGDLDNVNLNANVIEQYIDDPRVQEVPALGVTNLIFNHTNPDKGGILGNLNFRKAMFYAMDRTRIAKLVNGIPATWLVPDKCLGDMEKRSTFRQMPESQAYMAPNNGYDPALAKEYYDKALKECGLKNLTLTLSYNEATLATKSASEFLQKALPEIFGSGFKLELQSGTSAILTSTRNRWKEGDLASFELQWLTWNTSTTAPWNGLKVFSSGYTTKAEPYFNKKFDALWEEANYGLKAKLDPAYRLQLTREMEQIALEDVAACPVFESPRYFLIAQRVDLGNGKYVPSYGFGFYRAAIKR